jgi:hypothetical protein
MPRFVTHPRNRLTAWLRERRTSVATFENDGSSAEASENVAAVVEKG